MTSPRLDNDPRLIPVPEPLHRQALVPELAVERFVRAVLPGLAGLDHGGVDISRMRPTQQSLRYELRAVVGTKVTRGAVYADQLGQHLDDASGANATGDIDGQAFPGELVDHG